ncbi:MAG TPA: ABC transporter permease [Kofleriaceae bacterium]|nr:ABC transporter permease [Kofleriaceae bacterium]
MLRDLLFRARSLLRRGAVERELDDELRFHLERQTEKHQAAGLSPAEAARRARLELGGLGQVKEECRDARGVGPAEDVVRDVRHGLRVLRRSPGFAAIAILTLGLGIGVNTALFSVVKGVLLDRLPYRDPDQLVTIHERLPGFERGSMTMRNFADWQAMSSSFAAMGITRQTGFRLEGVDGGEQVSAQQMSAGYFSVLGVEPALGRGFTRQDDAPGAEPVALISARLWASRFASSPSAVGKTLSLDSRDYTIVGVLPAGFDLRVSSFRTSDVYVPLGQLEEIYRTSRSARPGMHGIARLAPGVSIDRARADLSAIAARLAGLYPDTNQGIGATVVPLGDEMVGDVRPLLLVLLGAVGFVLLIACVNVSNLLLARASGRARELSIRLALGATRARLVRQLLIESMLVALAGGALGLLLAAWATPAALALAPRELPRAHEVSIDGGVLAFTLLLSLVSGVLFGLAPALRATDRHVQAALRDGGRTSSPARHRAQDILVVVDVAMVFVLLVGAGLMGRTLVNLWSADPGFDPAGATIFQLALRRPGEPATADAVRASIRDAEASLDGAAGVSAAGVWIGAMPLRSDSEVPFWLEGEPRPSGPAQMHLALAYFTTPGYRAAMGIRLLRGRFIGNQDDQRGRPVVVIDEVMAREHFGTDDPVGKRIHLWAGPDQPSPVVEIVGVVGHIKQWGLDLDDLHPIRSQIYIPLLQSDDPTLASIDGVNAVARADDDEAEPPLSALRAAVQAGGAGRQIYDASAMDELVSGSLARQRFAMLLLSVFAGLALLLATIGIYGVISYGVGQRVGEIGVRMALGARRRQILWLVVARGVRLTVIGIALGAAAGLGLTRLMTHLVHGVSAADPATFIAVAMILLAVTLAACCLPARRAMLVEPMTALRHE